MKAARAAVGVDSPLTAEIRLEVTPSESIVERIQANVAPGATLTVTSLPLHGPSRTLAVSERLVELGYVVVPHFAARSIAGRSQLEDLLDRTTQAGIDEVLAIGGDARQAAGPYTWAGALVEEIRELAPSLRIGIAGYPEGHPRFGAGELLDALHAKERFAAKIVTQLCFSPRAIERWLEEIRQRGIALPVVLGIPGAVERARLLRIAAQIGVGTTTSFVRGNLRVAARLVAHRAYRPEPLLRTLDPLARRDDLGVAGIHIYTFNQLTDTERWRASSRRPC